jgi:hypothetical protein
MPKAGATQGRGTCQGSVVADTTLASASALRCTSHWLLALLGVLCYFSLEHQALMTDNLYWVYDNQFLLNEQSSIICQRLVQLKAEALAKVVSAMTLPW